MKYKVILVRREMDDDNRFERTSEKCEYVVADYMKVNDSGLLSFSNKCKQPNYDVIFHTVYHPGTWIKIEITDE